MPFDPSRVRAVLFDLDGTLADTDDAYIRRASAWLRRLRFLFPGSDPSRFLRRSLMLAETPLTYLMGVPDWLGIDAPLARATDWLADRRGPRTHAHFVLLEGVQAMLPALGERYPLAIVTARGARMTNYFVKQFGFETRFGALASSQTVARTKPYPDPVRWAAQQLSVPVDQCVMIGDTTVDILAGKRAGAQTIGVLCGFGERRELERAGADLIVEQTPEVAALLTSAAPPPPAPPA
jgi:phosphoglycolate phosphatase-like HAD superfamily hydrolase